MTRVYERRIAPANLRDLPTVLDSEQMANVLRVSIERVRELTEAGELRRLTYTRSLLYPAWEARRFLRAHSGDDVGAA